MSYEITKLQNQMRTLIDDAERIVSKSYQAPGDSERLKEINNQVGELKATIEARQNAQWARGSAGMLPLSGQVTVGGMVKSGTTYIENRAGSLGIYSEGEGVSTDPQLRAIREPAYARAFDSYLRQGERALKGDALKTLQEGQDTAGGYLVPEDLMNRLLGKTPTPTRLNSRVARFTTLRDRVKIPKSTYTTDNKYTSPMRVTWTGEQPSSGSAHRVTEPTFGQMSVPIYTAMLSILVSTDLVDDSSYDLTTWLTSKFSETSDLLFDDMILNGTGAGQPRGILPDSDVTAVNTGAASTLTADGLYDLVFSLAEQYHDNATFSMNLTSTGKSIRKLKDGDGRYLWSMGDSDNALLAPAIRSSLLGYPVLYSGFMPDVEASAYPVIFGDLNGYFLVTRLAMSIKVAYERYLEENQVLIVGRIRFGGVVAEDYKLRRHYVSA